MSNEVTRETWGGKLDFLLSVVGFAVDLGNVWRFPYFVYKNEGGSFFVPYFLMLLIGGIPLFYLELALGQYFRAGAITTWGKICPLFKGIGLCVVTISFLTGFYYNQIIAWSFYLFIVSFSIPVPWSKCDPSWKTSSCYSLAEVNQTTLLSNITRRSAGVEFFERSVLELHKSSGMFDLGGIKWQMVLALFVTFLVIFIALARGISMSGKVVWFTAIFPYVVLVALLVRACFLPGSGSGVLYYITPKLSKLSNAQIWIDAATQVFFSLGPGFGVLLALSSYNNFHNNVYTDAMITSVINCFTSVLAGFVIFAGLGYISTKTHSPIEKVADSGPGLVFQVFPEVIASIPGSTFWAIPFFLMLITLGLDSSFGGLEAVLTALGDEIPFVKRHRWQCLGVMLVILFLGGLVNCTYGGAYIVTLMDTYAAGYSILTAVFLESIVISWIYGLERICDNIHEMMGFRPGIYWRICWKYAAPMFLLFNIIFGLATWKPLEYGSYKYTTEQNIIGFCISGLSLVFIPMGAIACLYKIDEKGLLSKLRSSIRPTISRDLQHALEEDKRDSVVTMATLIVDSDGKEKSPKPQLTKYLTTPEFHIESSI